MSDLLEEILRINQDAALALEQAEICTDSEILTLSQEDLHELFPGVNKLKLRETIFGIIQKRKLIDMSSKDLKPFLPDGNFRDDLSRSKTLADHLPILKAWKDEVEKLQSFLEAHIKAVENLTDAQPGQKRDRGEACALLEEIHRVNPEAAHVLRGAEICTNSQIQLLCREDLQELFPGVQKLNLRRTIVEIIHKQKATNVFPKEQKPFYPEGALWDAHSSSKTLADHSSILKVWKDEVEKLQSFLEAHIKMVENAAEAQPDQGAGRGETCALLEEINRIDPEAANELRRAEICTNSQIQLLSRRDLQDLFPGVERFKVRRTISGMINKHKPTFVLQKEPKQFFPDEMWVDLSSSKTLVDHLPILKAWKDEMEKWRSFLEAHIKVVENTIKAQPDQGAGRDSLSSYFSSFWGWTLRDGQTGVPPQEEFGNKKTKRPSSVSQLCRRPEKVKEKLKYKMVVKGKTFNAHDQLMEDVKRSTQEFEFVEVDGSPNSEESQINIVFCPIVSRVGTDVSEAMKAVPDNKPVILVSMHHAYEPRHVPSVKTWDNNDKILLHVNVFYHETKSGLISCPQNKNAVSEIQHKIIEMQRDK